MERNGLILCLVGPAGCGKTTLAQRLLSGDSRTLRGKISRAVSVTSRPPRPGERDGESYFFVTREEFLKRVSQDELFEWEEVHGNLYGQLRDTLESAVREGRDLILDIDIKGALNVKRAYPQYCAIVFITPPSFEALKSRLLARGTTDPEELKRRFATARDEYARMLTGAQDGKIDYLLVNDVLEDSLIRLQSVLEAERLRAGRIRTEALKSLCSVGEGT